LPLADKLEVNPVVTFNVTAIAGDYKTVVLFVHDSRDLRLVWLYPRDLLAAPVVELVHLDYADVVLLFVGVRSLLGLGVRRLGCLVSLVYSRDGNS